jgi:hypothetical protein
MHLLSRSIDFLQLPTTNLPKECEPRIKLKSKYLIQADYNKDNQLQVFGDLIPSASYHLKSLADRLM